MEESKTLKATEKSIFRVVFLLEVSDFFKLVCFLEVLLIMVKAGSNVHTFCSTHTCVICMSTGPYSCLALLDKFYRKKPYIPCHGQPCKKLESQRGPQHSLR